MRKQLFAIILCAPILCFIFPSVANAIENNPSNAETNLSCDFQGWDNTNSSYCQNETLLTGLQEIDDEKYYFAENGEVKTGIQDIDNKSYYFSPKTKAMSYRQQLIDGHWYYFNPANGEMAKSAFINMTKADSTDAPKTVYYDDSGKMVYRQKRIDGYWYYFRPNNGNMVRNSFVDMTSADSPDAPKTVYYDESGHMLYRQQFLYGHWYYFNPNNGAIAKSTYVTMTPEDSPDAPKTVYYDWNGYMVHGHFSLPDGEHFFNPYNGDIQRWNFEHNNVYYEVDWNGFLHRTTVRNLPYYNQNDQRWKNIKIGNNTLGKSGCSMMTATSIVNFYNSTNYMPNDIAWTAYTWGQFNTNGFTGTISTYWRRFSSAYGIPFKSSHNILEISRALRAGKLVKTSVGKGTFVKGGSHALLLSGYADGDYTYVYDPANPAKNGWYSLWDIWNQQSNLPDDTYDGGPFFILWK